MTNILKLITDALRQKSQSDSSDVQEAHNHLCEMGAKCRECAKCKEAAATPAQEAALALAGEFLPLRESAVAADGGVNLKIIQPGWGSSGYYPSEVLRRDGPAVFAAGTKMYWNHQTAAEESERPEGDLNDLAGELTSNAEWQDNGIAGPGLYARAKVFSHYAESVNELAPSIGVSIRAMGSASNGEAEGRKGRIIEAIQGAKSVDFVTEPGAGGEILQLFEAARVRRGTKTNQENTDVDATKLTEAQNRIAELEQKLVMHEAAAFADEKLAAQTSLPAVTIARLKTDLLQRTPIKEGKLDAEAFAALIEAAVSNEAKYIAALTESGRITGMGSSSAGKPPAVALEEADKSIESAFRSLGMKESTAQLAARGRK